MRVKETHRRKDLDFLMQLSSNKNELQQKVLQDVKSSFSLAWSPSSGWTLGRHKILNMYTLSNIDEKLKKIKFIFKKR